MHASCARKSSALLPARLCCTLRSNRSMMPIPCTQLRSHRTAALRALPQLLWQPHLRLSKMRIHPAQGQVPKEQTPHPGHSGRHWSVSQAAAWFRQASLLGVQSLTILSHNAPPSSVGAVSWYRASRTTGGMLGSTCWLLVVSCWLLVVSCWLLVVSCWLLAVSCWLLDVGRCLLVMVSVAPVGC